DASAVVNVYVDLYGNNGNNSMTGAPSDDILHGNGGNDTLLGGGGSDEVNGDDGNDLLIWDPLDNRTDGGEGTDALQVRGANVVVDLRTVDNDVITGTEIIDLTGTGNNTLKLELADVLAIN